MWNSSRGCPVPSRQSGSAFSPGRRAILFALAAFLFSACSGVLVEPTPRSVSAGDAVKFWGFSLESGQSMRLEALTTSGQWELRASGVSVTVPSYAADQTGYYFEITTTPSAVPVRFKHNVSGASFDVYYRVYNTDSGVAFARGGDSWNSSNDMLVAFGHGVTDGVVKLHTSN